MATEAGKVYASADEMIAGVSMETGLAPEDVRKVVRASFASTKDFILRELAEAQEAKPGAAKRTSALSDADLDKVAGGIVAQYSSGLSLFSQRYSISPSLLEKIGALGP